MAWQENKARENLQAGIEALAKGHVNAAANRLYYSLYHLAWGALERAGLRSWQFDTAAQGSWKHETIRTNTALIARHLLGATDRRAVSRLKFLIDALHAERINADYCPVHACRAILEKQLPILQALFEGKTP